MSRSYNHQPAMDYRETYASFKKRHVTILAYLYGWLTSISVKIESFSGIQCGRSYLPMLYFESVAAI